MRNKLPALITAAVLATTMAGTALGHHATVLAIGSDCDSFDVNVGFEDFGDGHRLRVEALVDGVQFGETFTPEGDGVVTLTGPFDGSGTISARVTTPDDQNAPLRSSETFENECAEETPAPTPTPTPSPSPSPTPNVETSSTPAPSASESASATPSPSVAETPEPSIPNTATTIFGDRTQVELLLIGLGLFVILMFILSLLGRVRKLY